MATLNRIWTVDKHGNSVSDGWLHPDGTPLTVKETHEIGVTKFTRFNGDYVPVEAIFRNQVEGATAKKLANKVKQYKKMGIDPYYGVPDKRTLNAIKYSYSKRRY